MSLVETLLFPRQIKMDSKATHTNRYASTPFPHTIYAPHGIDLYARDAVAPQDLTSEQVQEVERLRNAEVTHRVDDPINRGWHLALTEATMYFAKGSKKAIITANATPGDYVTSRALLRPDVIDIPPQAKTVGAGIVLKTSDGYLLYSNRDVRNGNYSAFRDGSANGVIEIGETSQGQHLTPDADRTMQHEIVEEMKLSEDALKTITMIPLTIVKDERLPHYNIMYGGRTTKTADEIIKAQGNLDAHNEGLTYTFAERLGKIKATPRAIRQFILDTTQAPLTPSAVEMFKAAGARIVFERALDNGDSVSLAILKAEIWRRRIDFDSARMFRRLDRQVRRHNRQYPESLIETENLTKPTQYWRRGIDPARNPQAQGLKTHIEDTPTITMPQKEFVFA